MTQLWKLLGRVLRAATVVVSVLAALSLGNGALVAAPFLLPLLIWSFFTGGRWMRVVYVPFACLYGYVLAMWGLITLDGKQAW